LTLFLSASRFPLRSKTPRYLFQQRDQVSGLSRANPSAPQAPAECPTNPRVVSRAPARGIPAAAFGRDAARFASRRAPRFPDRRGDRQLLGLGFAPSKAGLGFASIMRTANQIQSIFP
jgi:hypothetical protein